MAIFQGAAARARTALSSVWERAARNRDLRLAALCTARAALGFLLGRGQILGGASPFGLAGAAAAVPGYEGFSQIAGVLLGYLSRRSPTGLLLMAGTLAVLAGKLILMRRERRRWLMPIISSAAFACPMLLYIAALGWPPERAAYFFSGVLLSGAAAFLFSDVPEEDKSFERQIRFLALSAAALISLADVTVLAEMSVGRLAAALAVLTAAGEAGPGWGSCAGLCAGLSMDLALGCGPLFSAVYAFGGFISGICARRGKLLGTLAYVLTAAVCSLWAWGTPYRLAVYFETFTASVMYMVLPGIELPVTAMLTDGSETSGQRTLNRARLRLEGAAKAFRELYESLSRTFAAGQGSEDAFSIFTRAAERVCRRCKGAPRCWGTESEATKAALNTALPAMLEAGEADRSHFPEHFRNACRNFDDFFEEVRRQLKLTLQTRRQRARQRENEKLLCRQYSDLAHILSDCAEEFPAQVRFDAKAERLIRRRLLEKGVRCRVTVFTGEFGRLRVELLPDGKPDAALLKKELDGLLRRKFEAEDVTQERICFMEAEPFRIMAGAAAGKKQGEQVSGDSATYFKTPEGLLYVLLADGMGSGEEAAGESRMTLEVLERFLRAGVSAEIALRTVDSALVIRNRESGIFSTVDLLRVNLFTGQAAIFKYGAAPSYIKRGSEARRLTCGTLPIGMGELKGSPAQARFTMQAGDFIVMISDGIWEDEGDLWLTKLISESECTSPREMAASIMAAGAARNTPSDDMTVCVFKLEAV